MLSAPGFPRRQAPRLLAWLTLALQALALGACVSAPEPHPQALPGDWQPVAIPGKLHTHYNRAHKDGREATAARCERSASMLRKRVQIEPVGSVSFSWWVEDLIAGAGVADIDRADALHRRDLRADFRLAFGEAPGPLQSIAVMTDSDNPRSSALSWYGAVTLH
jgi:hypothetical protein